MDKQVRYMMRNPTAFMDCQSIGRLPKSRESESCALRELVARIPVRYWSLFSGVSLSPDLGFNSAMKFGNLHQMMRYLGFNQKIIENERLPYQFYLIRDVRDVRFEQLLLASKSTPDADAIESIKRILPTHLV